MTNSSYFKKESFREPKSRVKTKKYSFNDSIESTSNIVSEHYMKSDGKLSTKLFIIVSGGTKKERQYFSLLINKKDKFTKIKIEFISKDGEGLTALKLYETALRIKEKAKDSIFEEDDLFYLISDRDHFYPELVEIYPKCEVENFNLIISNPCFEIWLYYGFFESAPDKNGFSYSDIKKISSEFKSFISEKIVKIGGGGADPRKALFSIKTAIKNSKSNYSVDDNKICNIYSTNMHFLAEAMLPLIETELNEIQEEKTSSAEEYKN